MEAIASCLSNKVVLIFLLLPTTFMSLQQGDVSSSYVTTILSVHGHYMNMVLQVFDGHCGFQSAFDRVGVANVGWLIVVFCIRHAGHLSM